VALRLRLLTYNIHKCIGGLDRRYAPERVRDTIAHYEPDVVCLQEVDAEARRSQYHRQVDVLGDMLTASRIDPADVEAEREVILDEIAMHDDDPDDVVHNLFTEQAWGGTPLGRPVAGTVDSIAALTRDQIRRFYRARYTAPHMVVSVAGNVDLIAIVRVPKFDDIAEVIAGKISKCPGVVNTESFVAFRAFSRHDLDDAFAIGLPDAD